jgi:hypothetical protein
MSKLFYDHLVLVDELFTEIDTLSLSETEKTQIKKVADDLLNHRILIRILDLLPQKHHDDFLTRFHKAPAALTHITYLETVLGREIQGEIILVAQRTKTEIRQELHKHKRHQK